MHWAYGGRATVEVMAAAAGPQAEDRTAVEGRAAAVGKRKAEQLLVAVAAVKT